MFLIEVNYIVYNKVQKYDSFLNELAVHPEHRAMQVFYDTC